MSRRLNWAHIVSVVSLTILIGVELLVAGIAAGWAVAGLFGLGDMISYILQGAGALFALRMVWVFFVSARKAEPFTG